MVSNKQWNPEKNARRTIWWGLAIFLFFAALSAAWFVIANIAKSEFNERLAQFNSNERSLDCPDLDIVGFPFRMGVSCSKINFMDAQNKVSFQAGALKTAAQIYAPKKHVAQLQAPAQLSLPSKDLFLNWEKAYASARLEKNFLPKDLRIEAHSMTANLSDETLPPISTNKLFSAGILSEEDADKLNWFLSAEDVMILGSELPAINAELSASLPQAQRLMLDTDKYLSSLASEGTHIILNNLTLQLDKQQKMSQLLAKGRLRLGKNGFLWGEIELAARNIEGAIATLQAYLPEPIKANAELLIAMTQPSETDPNLRILPKITINNGAASFGFIPIGNIPPLAIQ